MSSIVVHLGFMYMDALIMIYSFFAGASDLRFERTRGDLDGGLSDGATMRDNFLKTYMLHYS